MNKWYGLIVINEDISKINDCIDYFEKELNDARKECKIDGSLEKAHSELPSFFEYRYSQLQELAGILEYLNIEYRSVRAKTLRNFMEHYNRDLTAREAEKWIDGEDDVVTWAKIINSIALIHNQFIGITKALDTKNFQIGHITKLRTAGIEDATL